jgi:hypothetical protein
VDALDVDAVLRDRLPIGHGGLELSLDGPVVVGPDGALLAPLCLADLDTGELMTQRVRLAPPGVGASERTVAHVQAWIDRLPQLLARCGGALQPPAHLV